jgi:hypothetical protein
MSSVYKVTAAVLGKTKRGYEVFKFHLNNSFWATKLVPLRKLDRKYDKLFKLYTENNNSLEFLVGKFISVNLDQSEYGLQFNSITSLDVFQDFKRELDNSKGKAFSTRLPIYDFLSNMKRPIEPDGSIKLSTDFGDMRISKVDEVNISYQYNESNEYLNLGNLKQVFDRFYKNIILPPYDNETSDNSYYEISLSKVGIVRMDHRVKVSINMTTSGDYDKWDSTVIQKIGDKLPLEHVSFLKNKAVHQTD